LVDDTALQNIDASYTEIMNGPLDRAGVPQLNHTLCNAHIKTVIAL